MRSAVAAAVFAGAAMAWNKPGSTTYTTMYYTITDCPDTVTECPGDYMETTSSVVPMTTSTVYTTKVYTVTDCPDYVPECPGDYTHTVTATEAAYTTVCPVDEPTYTPPPPMYYNTTSTYCPPEEETSSYVMPEEECPMTSVKTISTSYTTVIPTVIYETVEVPCPEPTTTYPPAMNTTTYAPPTYTAGASSMGASLFLAGAAVAAFLA